jgi:WD40 repeat protein
MGERLLVRCGGAEGTLVQYGTTTKHRAEVARGDLVGMAVAQDGSLGVGAQRSGKLTLVDRKGTVETAAGPEDIAAVALAPAGDRLVVATRDGAVHWAPVNGGKPGAFHALPEKIVGPPLALGAGPDGALFAIGANRRARLWLEGRSLGFEVGSPAFSWSTRDHLLLFASVDDDVTLVSLFHGEPVGRLQGSSGAITGIHAHEQGPWVVVSSEDGATRGYLLEDCSTLVTRGPLPTPPAACAVAPDATSVVCGTTDALTVASIRGSSGGPKAPRSRPLEGPPKLVAASPRGERLAWASAGRWGVEERSFDGLPTPTALRLSERHGALAGKDAGGAGALRIVALQGGEARAVKLEGTPVALTFSPDGGRLVVLTAEGTALLLDPASGAQLRSIPLEAARLEGDPTALALSDDGAALAVGSAAGVVAVAPLEGRGPRRIGKFLARIDCLAWAQGGRALAVATRDLRQFALDTDTGQSFLTSHDSAPVVGCARSPIDDRFSHVMASGVAQLRLIDAAPLTMSKAPEPPLDPRTMPLTQWPGFPKVWR